MHLRLRRAGGVISRIGNARNTWTRRDSILMGLWDGDDLLGLGEAAPLPGWSAETLEDVVEVLRDFVRIRALQIESTSPLATGHGGEGPGVRAPSESNPWFFRDGSNGRTGHGGEEPEVGADLPASALFALETAAIDAGFADPGQRRPIVRNILAGMIGDPAAEEHAARRVLQGARHVKWKATGSDPSAEVDALRRFNDRVGHDLRHWLDLNGVLDADSARRALDVYSIGPVDSVEEPTSSIGLLALSDTPVRWWVDESLATVGDSVLRLSSCAGIVLKPSLLGGWTVCLDWASRARQHGKSTRITHAFEGPIGLVACAGIAGRIAAEDPGSQVHGLDRHPALTAFAPVDLPGFMDIDGEMPSVVPSGGWSPDLRRQIWEAAHDL